MLECASASNGVSDEDLQRFIEASKAWLCLWSAVDEEVLLCLLLGGLLECTCLSKTKYLITFILIANFIKLNYIIDVIQTIYYYLKMGNLVKIRIL
jgi:hypothetical protein